jgi:hypothetical protein
MPEQDASKDPAKQIQSQPEPIEPIRTDEAKVIPSSHSSNEERNKTKEDEPKWTDKAMAFFTVCLVGVAVWQGHIFNKQLGEMHTGGEDTHNLALAAVNQATWTQRLAESTGTQSDRTRDLADRMKDQADRTKTIAEQAIVQANANQKLAQNAIDTLANSKQSFRDEQRAWIGVQGVADSKGFTEKEPWQITVVFFNSGRTPARNVQVSGMFVTSPVPISGPSPQQVSQLVFRPAQSIAPQGFYRESMAKEVGAEGSRPYEISGQQTLVSQYTQIKNRQLFLYYYGLLKYEGVPGETNETQFCILLADPDTKEPGMCDTFNDLN